jgi:acyl-CoA thioesterase-1
MIMAVRFLTPLLIAVLTGSCGSSPSGQSASAGGESAPAKAAVRAEKPTPPVTDTRAAIAAFGDSLSAGYGLDPGDSYPSDLQKLIDQAGYRYRVVNMGVSGDTTTDGVTRMPDVLALHAEIVILEFGGNDGLRGQPVTTTRANLASMIEGLQKAGSTVVLAGITLPRNYGPDYIRQFDAVFVDLAKEYRLTRIPFLLEGVGGVPSLTQPDGLHPTAQGAAIVAKTVMKYVQPLLKK